LSPPLPSYFAPIKSANPGSPGKMAVKTDRESYGYNNVVCDIKVKANTIIYKTNWIENLNNVE